MNETSESKPKSLMRYSLRFLLLLTTVAGVSLGICGNYKSERDAERDFIEKFPLKYVYYDFQLDPFSGIDVDAQPKGPKWIRDSLKDDLFFARVKEITIGNDDSIDSAMPLDIPSLDGIAVLRKLERLRVESSGLNNIQDVAELDQLKELSLSGLGACGLEAVGGLENLRLLELSPRQDAVFSLAPLRGHQKLESIHLGLFEVSSFDNAEALATLPGLKNLFIHNAELRTGLTETESDRSSGGLGISCPNLEMLKLGNNKNLKSLGPFSVAPKLQTLSLIQCELIDLSDPGVSFPSLKNLQLEKNNSLITLDGFSASTQLVYAILRKNPNLKSIEGLRGATKFADLEIYQCHSLANLDGLEDSTELSKVWICGCDSLEDILGLSAAAGLRRLTLDRVGQLSSLDGLQAQELEYFEIRGCDHLTSMGPLTNAKKLKTLVFERCPRVKAIELHPDVDLKTIQLSGDFSLSSLQRTFHIAENLTSCILSGCSEVESLDLIQNCVSLENLSANYLANLTSLTSSDVTPIANLQRLEIQGCDRLLDLQGIAAFRNVSQLRLSRCQELSDVSQLSQLSGLSILEIQGCPKIVDADFIGQLKKLENIERICFDRASVQLESLAELAEELSVNILLDGRHVNSKKWERLNNPRF